MVTVIAGIIPEWENKKLFTYLSDRVALISQKGCIITCFFCDSSRAKILFEKSNLICLGSFL